MLQHSGTRLRKNTERSDRTARQVSLSYGRLLAARLGHDARVVDALPDEAVEPFAGVANP
jgi:hypothetical protein